MDWAMKFLQLRYREKQSEWYGKRGLSWHISSVISISHSGTTEVISYHRRTGTFGLGGAVTFLPEKNCAMPERVEVQIGMQTQTFTIFPSNETATIGKIAQLKVCRLNSINCLNFI